MIVPSGAPSLAVNFGTYHTRYKACVFILLIVERVADKR